MRAKIAKWKKVAHVVYQCSYHLVWTPKYRYRILQGDIEEYVEKKIRAICEWKHVEILELIMVRGLLNNAQRWVKEWVSQTREDIPFPLLDIDSDNGGGFINHQLLDWYIQHGIKFTRSRPCHKNDNLDAQYCTHYAAMFGVYTVESESLINGWHISTIGEYTDLKSGYAFKNEWWQDTGYKVIKTANVSNSSIDLNNCDYVSTANTTKSAIFSIVTPSDDDCFTYKFIYVKTGAANTGKVFFSTRMFTRSEKMSLSSGRAFFPG